ncbi:hypothetical protein ACIHCQ_31650 [Streptomyces sp. NPDC052236]
MSGLRHGVGVGQIHPLAVEAEVGRCSTAPGGMVGGSVIGQAIHDQSR